VNAAILATQILGVAHPRFREAVKADRQSRREVVLATSDPRA
jgi:phosphoribosylcarboxyaminoimidazole (NCAIR) mutase